MNLEVARVLDRCRTRAEEVRAPEAVGRVVRVAGPLIESIGPVASVGELCRIGRPGDDMELAEVVGFQGPRLLLMTFGRTHGFHAGAPVWGSGAEIQVPVGAGLLGRVVDALGNPIDDRGPLVKTRMAALDMNAPHPLQRKPIREPLGTGIRAIDAFLTLGKGQRMGVFAGSGVGKSVLLGDIARFTEADVAVVALIGERGREVGEFLRRDLGEEGLSRAVVVVATADQPPLLRVKAAFTATRIAEAFRDQGKQVLLLMDSLTRVAMAQREIGLTRGEPPTTRGYTPSVFSVMPQLLERAGSGEEGSVTGLYTVLVEGDDMNDPIADAARSILDGHVVLSRKLANKGHFPAIDVLSSISRLATEVSSPDHLNAQRQVRRWLAAYADSEDLIQLGAYARGADPAVDEAIDRMPQILSFLRQNQGEGTDRIEMLSGLGELVVGTTAEPVGRADNAVRGATDEEVSVRSRGTGAREASGGPAGGDPSRRTAADGTDGALGARPGRGNPGPLGSGAAGGGRLRTLDLGNAEAMAARGDRALGR
ncbi:MAG: FliI/YscN family ATPase [Candidatus Eisenbacteria bacterium]